ncbi:MAG TPA: hypothetical protein VMU95_01935 [Trebonia sp.]|nr:hypothetical protein [Trebonia sp.]
MAQDGTAGDVSVSGSIGVQAGDGNTQINNNWSQTPPLDPAILAALNPDTAVKRLRGMPHNDAVDLLARAAPADVAEMLKVFLDADESRAIAILADINPRRSVPLIEPLAAEIAWLPSLPVAAVAIGRRTRELKWNPRPDAGYVQRVIQPAVSTMGFFVEYEEGRIYWSPGAGARSISGEIATYYMDDEEIARELGFPVEDEAPAPVSPLGTSGSCQRFEGGLVYVSESGAYAVTGDIYAHHAHLGGSAGWLGFPVAASDGEDEAHEKYTYQEFQGGVCVFLGDHARTVRKAINDYLDDSEGDGEWEASDDDEADFDITDEEAVQSSSGVLGSQQVFTIPKAGEFVVFATEKYGISAVGGRIGEYYWRIGGPASWLGFPKGDQAGSRQAFEGGTVYAGPDADPVAVPEATMAIVFREDDGWDPLGPPVSGEQPIGAAGNESIQFFESGAVIVRGGQRALWHEVGPPEPAVERPDPSLAAPPEPDWG